MINTFSGARPIGLAPFELKPQKSQEQIDAERRALAIERPSYYDSLWRKNYLFACYEAIKNSAFDTHILSPLDGEKINLREFRRLHHYGSIPDLGEFQCGVQYKVSKEPFFYAYLPFDWYKFYPSWDQVKTYFQESGAIIEGLVRFSDAGEITTDDKPLTKELMAQYEAVREEISASITKAQYSEHLAKGLRKLKFFAKDFGGIDLLDTLKLLSSGGLLQFDYTDKELEKIVAKANKTPYRLRLKCAVFNPSLSAIIPPFKRQAIQQRELGKKYTQAIRKAQKAGYKTAREIADVTGLSEQAVLRKLKALGEKIIGPKERNQIKVREWMEKNPDRSRGWKKKCQEETGLSRDKVRVILKEIEN